jgi:hypothetical protein
MSFEHPGLLYGRFRKWNFDEVTNTKKYFWGQLAARCDLKNLATSTARDRLSIVQWDEAGDVKFR